MFNIKLDLNNRSFSGKTNPYNCGHLRECDKVGLMSNIYPNMCFQN